MNETILVVDDEERIRHLIAAYLKREGYRVIEAENGLEALKKFKTEIVHLIILDIMMPVMDGWTACKEIRSFSEVPIIFLTAKSEDEDKLMGFELGTDNYVTKPFNAKILVANVRSLLNRTYVSKVRIKQDLFFDGIHIDELSHNVTVDGEEIYLSPKEYELLIYFVTNKNIVLSREKILDNIWGIDYFGDLRTVDTHIKRLREKLGGKAYLITTVRGTGYKFEVKNER